MSSELQGQKIAILAAEGVERIELEQPRGALHGAGAQTELLSIHEGEIEARQHDLETAATFPVDKVVSQASLDDYDALVLPGGAVNPDKLRMDRDAVAFVRAFADSGKPIAAICHAPWTLLEAGVVRGRRLTSWSSIRTDLRNAGAEVVDEEVVIDGQLTTSRSPADLQAFLSGDHRAVRRRAATHARLRAPGTSRYRAGRDPGGLGRKAVAIWKRELLGTRAHAVRGAAGLSRSAQAQRAACPSRCSSPGTLGAQTVLASLRQPLGLAERSPNG